MNIFIKGGKYLPCISGYHLKNETIVGYNMYAYLQILQKKYQLKLSCTKFHSPRILFDIYLYAHCAYYILYG